MLHGRASLCAHAEQRLTAVAWMEGTGWKRPAFVLLQAERLQYYEALMLACERLGCPQLAARFAQAAVRQVPFFPWPCMFVLSTPSSASSSSSRSWKTYTGVHSRP
jgi:hypothetical protein